MTQTVSSLGSRYAAINNDLAKMTTTHAGNGDKAVFSRLILRAAVLNARLHNDDETVGRTIRALAQEVGL